MNSLTVCILALSVSLIGGNLGFAASLPFSENFDDDAQGTTLPADFTETPAGIAGTTKDYAIAAGPVSGNVLRSVVSGTTATTGVTAAGASVSAAVSFPGTAGNSFTISTDFVIDDFTSVGEQNTLNLGLVALGTLANFSDANNLSYRLLYTLDVPGGANSGKLSLSETGTGAANLTGSLLSSAINAITLDTVYTLTLTGTYSGGNLVLNGTLTGGGGTTLTVSGTDTSPAAGNFFGYRTAINAQRGMTEATGAATASQNINYDNFSVVPEPGSSAILLTGIWLLASVRRSGRNR